jgi:hypothetical protein
MKMSDLLMVLEATALLNPCFFKNKVKTALASSFSAANRAGGTTFKLNDPSIAESSYHNIKKNNVNIVKEKTIIQMSKFFFFKFYVEVETELQKPPERKCKTYRTLLGKRRVLQEMKVES